MRKNIEKYDGTLKENEHTGTCIQRPSEQDALFLGEQRTGFLVSQNTPVRQNALGNPNSILIRAGSQSCVCLIDVQIRLCTVK